VSTAPNLNHIPSNTSLFIGPDLRIEGRITQTSKDEVIVVAGTLAGDIVSEGVVLVMENGLIEASNELRCFELQVRGKVESKDGKNVMLEAGLLKLSETARVNVGEIKLPPGGLEQARGGILCARLSMSEENSFAKDERLARGTREFDAKLASPGAPLSGLKVQPSSGVFAKDENGRATRDAQESSAVVTTSSASTSANTVSAPPVTGVAAVRAFPAAPGTSSAPTVASGSGATAVAGSAPSTPSSAFGDNNDGLSSVRAKSV